MAQLLRPSSRRRGFDQLTPRERKVLAVMADGRSNAAIAARLVITEKSVSNHVDSIFTKLDLPPSGEDHRRVLPVLTHLEAGR